MTALVASDVATSLNRALWGEVSPSLRSVQFAAERQHITLRFFFDGAPKDADRELVNCIGAEVARIFPGAHCPGASLQRRLARPFRAWTAGMLPMPARKPGWLRDRWCRMGD